MAHSISIRIEIIFIRKTGGGTFINFRPPNGLPISVFSTVENNREYGVGDVIDINVRFNIPIKIVGDLFLVLEDFPRVVYFSSMLVRTYITLILIGIVMSVEVVKYEILPEN